jgi:ABC-type branched-subunit amino acid transport system substrate-binding protein
MKKRLASIRKHKGYGLTSILMIGVFLILAGGFWLFSKKYKISARIDEQVNTQPLEQKTSPEPVAVQVKQPQSPPIQAVTLPQPAQNNGQANGTNGNEILVGSLIGQQGQSTDMQKDIQNGIEIQIDAINKQGGINGDRIKFIFYDHEYNTNKAINGLQNLIKQNVKILLLPVGTPTVEACIPLIKENDILVIFPNSGAKTLRSPNFKNIVSFRTSYQNEAQSLLNYAAKISGSQKIAFFYQDDGYGKSCLEGAIAGLKINNFTDSQILKVSYTANTIDVSEAAEQIKIFDPDSIVIFGLPPLAQSLFTKLDGIWLLRKKFFGISALITSSFLDYIKQKGLKFTFSHTIPNPKGTQLKITQEYRDAIKKHNLQHSDYLFLSYISTNIFFNILSQLDKPITKEKISVKIEQIKNLNFKGLNLNFDPQTRELNKDVWIETSDGQWIKASSV